MEIQSLTRKNTGMYYMYSKRRVQLDGLIRETYLPHGRSPGWTKESVHQFMVWLLSWIAAVSISTFFLSLIILALCFSMELMPDLNSRGKSGTYCLTWQEMISEIFK